MIYFCCDKLRRNALKGSTLNGIDYLEVLDRDAPTQAERQRKLFIHFINTLSGPALTADNIRIEGGERVRDIVITKVTPGSGGDANILTVEVDQPGDYSIYTLRIVQDAQHPQPPPGYDSLLSEVEFSFKVECPSDFDCRQKRICPPAPRSEPEINYLAKDYSSFRRLMRDRLAVLSPQWKERSPADLGLALVELLAFVGDTLSYRQDAIGTEAYLGTARRRISVRRHARLVDYLMHDGCNARAWVHIQVKADTGPLPKGTVLSTRIPGQSVILPNDSALLRRAQGEFETMHDVPMLYNAHNEMPFYTWTDERCCLPKGATQATLKGHYPNLKKGDVLVFEELIGPDTGWAADADPAHRQAVRLIRDPILATDPLPSSGEPITDIAWAAEDALTFPLCISCITDERHGNTYLDKVSVARGNIVLADHGKTIINAPIPDTVPQPTIFRPPARGEDRCVEVAPVPITPRYRPQLKDQPLTHAAPFDPAASAAAGMRWDIKEAMPAVLGLVSQHDSQTAVWSPQRDLLKSAPTATEFVVEIDTDGTAFLRFGDGQLGRRPEPLTLFVATYRVGNGAAGNVGSESLVHIVTNLNDISAVRNPLPAQGGLEPETMEDVRQRAPAAFRTQERAVTEADYAAVTERDPRVQQAAATFRWTGSWHTAFLTADRRAGYPIDAAFKADIRRKVERYRMAGYDLEVDGPRFVALEIEMFVCVKPDYFRSEVKASLLELFSNRLLPDGRRGVFHPDNFTFGQPVYLSPIYAAAQSVAGVASARIVMFQRQSRPDPKLLADGVLPMGRLEIARLDNDPNFPERGVFRLNVGGGK